MSEDRGTFISGNRDTFFSGLHQHPVTRGFGRESWRDSWRSWRASHDTFARDQENQRASVVEDGRVVSEPLPPKQNSELLAPSRPSVFSLDESMVGANSATPSWYGAGLAPAPSDASRKPAVPPVPEMGALRRSSAQMPQIVEAAAGPRSPVLVQRGTAEHGGTGDQGSVEGVLETGSSQSRSGGSEGSENKQGSGKSSVDGSGESLVEVKDLRAARESHFSRISEGNTLSSTSFSWDERAGEHLATANDPGFGTSAISTNAPRPTRHSSGP